MLYMLNKGVQAGRKRPSASQAPFRWNAGNLEQGVSMINEMTKPVAVINTSQGCVAETAKKEHEHVVQEVITAYENPPKTKEISVGICENIWLHTRN